MEGAVTVGEDGVPRWYFVCAFHELLLDTRVHTPLIIVDVNI